MKDYGYTNGERLGKMLTSILNPIGFVIMWIGEMIDRLNCVLGKHSWKHSTYPTNELIVLCIYCRVPLDGTFKLTKDKYGRGKAEPPTFRSLIDQIDNS